MLLRRRYQITLGNQWCELVARPLEVHVQGVVQPIIDRRLLIYLELSGLLTSEGVDLRRIVKFGGILLLWRGFHFWRDLDR